MFLKLCHKGGNRQILVNNDLGTDYPLLIFVRAKALLFIRFPPGLKSGVSQLFCVGYGHGFKGCLGLGTGFEFHPVA